MLRVAMVSVHGNPLVPEHLLGSEGKGGQNVYVRKMGEALSRMGCDVTWFTRSEAEEETGVVEKSKTLRLRYIVSGPQKYIHRDFLFEYLDGFAAQIPQNDFDIVFTNYWLSGYVGLQLQLPQVHTHHSLGKVKYRAIKRENWPKIVPQRLQVEETINEKAGCVFHLTEAEKEMCGATSGRVVHVGINVTAFKVDNRDEVRKKLNFKNGVTNILYVGRFAEQKGVIYALDAINQLRGDIPLKFRLIGNYKEGMEDAQTTYPHFDFLGPKCQQDVAKYMNSSDIVLVPSVYEPGGIVAVEAMAAGAVVVCSDVGGLREYVKEANGVRVPPKCPNSICKAVKDLVSDPEKMKRIRKCNLESSFNWDWSGVACRVNEYMRNVCNAWTEFELRDYLKEANGVRVPTKRPNGIHKAIKDDLVSNPENERIRKHWSLAVAGPGMA